MKITFLAALFVALGCASSGAAERSASPYNWTGFYVGAHLGGAWARSSSVTLNPYPVPFGFPQQGIPLAGSSGFAGGGQVGFDAQVSPHILLGLEADFSWTHKAASGFVAPLQGSPPGRILDSYGTASREIDWLGSLRPRGGVIFDRLLVYATGGAAFERVKFTANAVMPNLGDNGGFTTPGYSNAISWGWVAGGGVEYALTANWIVRAEYLHYHFNDNFNGPLTPRVFNAVTPDVTGIGFRYDAHTSLDVVRAAISYKFGGR